MIDAEAWTHDPNTGEDVWATQERALTPTGCPMTLQDLITAAGSVRGLARDLGVTHSTISRWKRGESQPRWDHFLRLCELSGVDPLSVKPSGRLVDVLTD